MKKTERKSFQVLDTLVEDLVNSLKTLDTLSPQDISDLRLTAQEILEPYEYKLLIKYITLGD